MPKRRTTKIGKINLPVDVRKSKDIRDFRDLVIAGPLTLVLVYADWCGHCVNFKEKVWNRVATAPRTNRNINMASVHYDMMDQTPLRNAKLEGYPSLMLVGTDEKPATFTGQEPDARNAMPTQPSTSEELEAMLATPLSGSVRNATTVATTVMNNVNNTSLPKTAMNGEDALLIETNTNTNRANTSTNRANTLLIETNSATQAVSPNFNNLRTTATTNTYVPNNNEMPPDAVTDIVTARTDSLSPTPTMKGGSLLESLYAVAKEGSHAALLVAASATLSRRLRKTRTRKSKRSKKTKTRRSR